MTQITFKIETPGTHPYLRSVYDRKTYSYNKPPMNVQYGDRVGFEHLYTRHAVEVDGRVGVVMAMYPASAFIRWEDGTVGRVPVKATSAKVLGIVQHGGLPWYGQFVRINAVGPHQGKVGMVTEPGQNSTYVAIPGMEERVKFSARYLDIIEARIVV